MAYGIGRIPQGTDPTAEAMAKLESERLQPRPEPTKRCSHCGRVTYTLMTSACGSVCPDCYDECSD